MISGLAKAITLYLTPLLALTAIFLSVFAFLSPVVMLHTQVALLVVAPKEGQDGPNLFMGFLGSCARKSTSSPTDCTLPSISPVYDLSVLPDKAPKMVLSSPTASTPAFIAVALAFSVAFFVLFTLISFRHKLGEKISAALNKPLIQRLSAWIGFLGFLIGLTAFLIVRMWFGKAVEDFNGAAALQGLQLVASTSNAFTMAWVAYAFYAVPVIISLSKLNVQASK